MGKYTGAVIVENRQYENPSDPTNSNYKVALEITVPDAVIDPATRKKLSEILTEINSKLSGKAASSHTHDGRYYTEAEINSKLSTIQSSVANAVSASVSTPFSVSTSSWTKLTTAVAGRTYKVTITATGATAKDIPDVYFNAATLAIAEKASVIADCVANAVVLYAKGVPTGTVGGNFFIKKG